MKDEVPVMQSCSAEVQSNPEAEEVSLQAEELQMSRSHNGGSPISADRSMLPAGSGQSLGKPAACSVAKGRGGRRDLLYLGNDLMETSQRPIL